MKKLFSLLIAIAFSVLTVTAQHQHAHHNTVKLSGTIFERENSDSVPLEYAVIALPDYGMSTASRIGGYYEFSGVPKGKTRLTITYVGKLPVEQTVNLTANTVLDFTLENENFRIKEVTVTAQASQAGQSTSSIIGRTAMDHMQATSLNDVMSLLPGGLTTEPNLSAAKTANIRGSGNMNSLGTAIIRDGAPVSNNANLQTLNPTIQGTNAANSTSLVGGGSNPMSGSDLRSISTDNIESIEVIRGIPSVEHGDLTSGAIIINTKAGREPLRITAKANPKVYMGSIGTGFLLGENRGALNVNADYTHNTNDPIESYRTYQRLSARVMYSKELWKHLRSNTSFNFHYGNDSRSLNPDDEDYKRASRSEEYGFTLNTNGTWDINKGWLKSLRYVVSGTYTSKQSFYQSMMTSNNTPYSMTTTDGTILSNFAGQDIFDADGNKITDFGDIDRDKYTYKLPANYFARYDIDSREVNVFAKLVGTLFKQTGMINNRILFGADFRTDGNVGHGKTFDPTAPPQREVTSANGSFRPRDYSDIPFINQVGVFAEENFSWQLGLRELRLQAGVRYDHASKVGGIVSPRFNGSFELIPNKLWIRGGYGVTAKMPTLLYLHPEQAYFEYKNLDEIGSSKIPEDEQLFITTTKVYDASNRNLKIATNRKAEAGIDMKLGQMTFSVTAFRERLKNGYSLNKTFDTFMPFMWNEYKRNSDGKLELASSNSVLSSWYTPDNCMSYISKGIEFDFNFGRIEKINTSISLNGSYIRNKSNNGAYTFYEPNNDKTAAKRTDVAIYAPGTLDSYSERFSTALRVTHNLPSIGFVVTLTAQTVWKDADWGKYGNDSIPIGYISLKDAKPTFFEEGRFNTIQDVKDAELNHLLKNTLHPMEIKESYSPYFCFNINVTKEIGDMMRVSFFANNMFRSYPRRESKRNPGSFVLLNNRFYFGIELALTL